MSDQNAPTQRQFKNSRLGLASFAISLTAGVLVVVDVIDEPFGNVMIFAGIGGVVGFALCIACLFQKEKKKLFPILGIIVSSPAVLALVFYVILIATYPGN